MARELETKILEVDPKEIGKKLKRLRAKKIQDTKLSVSWFGSRDFSKDKFYMRIRKYSDGRNELTWKGKRKSHGVSASREEINFDVSDFEAAKKFFEQFKVGVYAFQEKKRTSWTLRKWRFDMDSYPGIPTYLEIEATSERSIREAIKLLELTENETWNRGERKLIEEKYKKNWYKMKFGKSDKSR